MHGLLGRLCVQSHFSTGFGFIWGVYYLYNFFLSSGLTDAKVFFFFWRNTFISSERVCNIWNLMRLRVPWLNFVRKRRFSYRLVLTTNGIQVAIFHRLELYSNHNIAVSVCTIPHATKVSLNRLVTCEFVRWKLRQIWGKSHFSLSDLVSYA